jgi:hypothetical protein
MSNEFLGVLEENLLNQGQSPESTTFLTACYNENPIRLLHACSLLVLADVDVRAVLSAAVLMSRVLKPRISRPLAALSAEYRALPDDQRDAILGALFKCLMYQDPAIVNNGASGLSGVAAFTVPGFPSGWPDFYERLGELYAGSEGGGTPRSAR